MEACETSSMPAIKWLLDQGANPNVVAPDSKCTALLKAVESGSDDACKECVSLLVAHGAHVNARNKWKNSALHVAAFRGLVKTCELLLSNGAISSGTNSTGFTPKSLGRISENADKMAHVLPW